MGPSGKGDQEVEEVVDAHQRGSGHHSEEVQMAQDCVQDQVIFSSIPLFSRLDFPFSSIHPIFPLFLRPVFLIPSSICIPQM